MLFKKGEYIFLFNYFQVIFIICTMIIGIVGGEQNISLEHIKQQCIEKCPVQVSQFPSIITTTQTIDQTMRKKFFFFLICPLKSIYSII